MDNIENRVSCIALVCKQRGIQPDIAQLKRSLNGKPKSIQRLAAENGLTCKKIFCKNLKLPEQLPYPVIAEINNGGTDIFVKDFCCIIQKNKDYVVTADRFGTRNISTDVFNNIFLGTIYICDQKHDFSKQSGSLKDALRFFVLLKDEKKCLIQLFIASLMLCLFGVLTAFYFRFLIDEVFSGGLENMLTTFSVGFFGVILFQTILAFARNQLLNFLGHKIDATIMHEYFSHVLKLPMKFFAKYKTGEIISRMYDAGIIRNLISTTFLSVAIDAVMLIFGAFVLIAFGSELIIILLASVCLGALIAKIFSKPYRIKMNARAIAEAEKQSLLVEFASGIETIKALNADTTAEQMSEEKIINSTKKNLDIRTITNVQNVIQYFIQHVGSLLVYFFGGKAIISGEMSLGALISFVILSQYFIGPLFRFLTLQPALQEAETAAKRLAEIFDIPTEEDEQQATELFDDGIRGDIEFKNVCFSYDREKEKTLDNINLSIKSGSKIALVGESGSGKSTVAKLLMHFQNIDSGEITIDGKNLCDYNLSCLRKSIGYVPQESLLFSGTIAENIAFGNEHENSESVFLASVLSKADKFVQSLPHRYNTSVGERGATLSGGERQRIAIARAILKKPSIFILDEATSALDARLESELMDNLEELSQGKTLIMISHKLNTIKNFDTIIVFDKGKIIEQGTHEELLAHGGKYSELWYTQNMEAVA